jgi:hypothetical protein
MDKFNEEKNCFLAQFSVGHSIFFSTFKVSYFLSKSFRGLFYSFGKQFYEGSL